jgi:GAF domain-containing protein
MIAQAMDTLSIPIGAGAVGWVAKHLRPLVLRGTIDDGEPAVVTAVIPIRYHTDVVGVLAVESTSGAFFDEERLEILGSVATVVGREVGGMWAHQDSERRLTTLSALSELGVAFGAVPEREGLARLVSFSACTVLEADVSSVRLLAPGRSTSSRDVGCFDLLSAHGASVSGGDDPLSELEERIAREVVGTRSPCRDADLSGDGIRPLLERANVSGVLGVPIAAGEQMFGVLVVYRVAGAQSGAASFREEEVEVATRLAGYAASSAQRFADADDGNEAEGSGR